LVALLWLRLILLRLLLLISKAELCSLKHKE
jgi:hypothetical protein